MFLLASSTSCADRHFSARPGDASAHRPGFWAWAFPSVARRRALLHRRGAHHHQVGAVKSEICASRHVGRDHCSPARGAWRAMVRFTMSPLPMRARGVPRRHLV